MATSSDDNVPQGQIRRTRQVEKAYLEDHAELEEKTESDRRGLSIPYAVQLPNTSSNDEHVLMLSDAAVTQKIRTKKVEESKTSHEPHNNILDYDNMYNCGGESNFYAKRFRGRYPRLLQFISLEDEYESIYKTEDKVHTLDPKYVKANYWERKPVRKRKKCIRK